MIQLAVIAAAPARFDCHIFLEAPHGTEPARYGSPGQARLVIPTSPVVRIAVIPPGTGVLRGDPVAAGMEDQGLSAEPLVVLAG